MIITKQGTTNIADMLAKDALVEKVLRELEANTPWQDGQRGAFLQPHHQST